MAEPDPRDTRIARAHTVVGIDGSDQSRRALGWAVQFSHRTGSQVRAVAVWNVPVQFGAPAVFSPASFESEAHRWLSEALDEVNGASSHSVETTVVGGNPAEALLEAAKGAELLVVGNKGRGALAGALTGSVALRCAHHAECPVLLVP